MGEKRIDETDQDDSAVEKLIEAIAKRAAQKMPIAEGYLSAEDAARFIGNMPLSSFREKVGQGLIPAYKPGKYPVFDPKDLKEYVRRHKVRK